jgi:hypothetical protein
MVLALLAHEAAMGRRKQSGTAMTKERFYIHRHITDKIVSAIECGAGDFHLPWHRSAGSIMRPVNIASKKPSTPPPGMIFWKSSKNARTPLHDDHLPASRRQMARNHWRSDLCRCHPGLSRSQAHRIEIAGESMRRPKEP